MSYIGRGVDAISNVEKLDNITFDGSATYALTKSSAAFTPVGANNLLVSIDGVIQQGNFSVSTTNIVFDWSPTSSNTCNFILHYGTGVLNVPADGSIVAAKMAANSVDSDQYVDGSIDLAHMSSESVDEDNLHISNAGSNGQYLQKQSGNAGGMTWGTVSGFDVTSITGATALGATPADTDEFVLSDAGTLKRVDYSHIKGETNTPAFSVYRSSTQTGIGNTTYTKIQFNAEKYDTDNAFDSSTNYRFTVPSGGAGKYFFTARARSTAWTSGGARLIAYHNGSTKIWTGITNSATSGGGYHTVTSTFSFNLAESDYIEMYYWHDSGSTEEVQGDSNDWGLTSFAGFKVTT